MDLLEKQKQTQIAFATAAGAISFIISAALPPLAYLLLSGASMSLLLYRQQWDNITATHAPLDLDKTSLTLMGFGVLITGIFFMPLNPFTQMILSSLIGAGLGGYFANQCVQKSQTGLNDSLHAAVKISDVNEVNRLIKLGADLFASDAQGNCALHHSIQNHRNSPLVLRALQRKAQKIDHEFHSVLTHAKALFTDKNIRQQWLTGWQKLKTCFNENNAKNRVALSQACNHIFEAYLPVLKKCLQKLTRYLRENAAYPKNVNLANHHGATAVNILNTIKLSENVKRKLNTVLTEMNVKEGTLQKLLASEVAKPTTQPAQSKMVEKKTAHTQKISKLGAR